MSREPYTPPTGDEPLDAIEEALVRALVPMLVEEIRQELAAEQRQREALEESAASVTQQTDRP